MAKKAIIILGITLAFWAGFLIAPKAEAAIIIDATADATSTLATNVYGIAGGQNMYPSSTNNLMSQGDYYMKFHIGSSSIAGGDYGMLGFINCSQQSGLGDCKNATGYSTSSLNSLSTNTADTGIVATLDDTDVVLRFPAFTTSNTGDFVNMGYFGNTITDKSQTPNGTSTLYLWGCTDSTYAGAWACGSTTTPAVFQLAVPIGSSTMPYANWNWLLFTPGITSSTNGYFGVQYGTSTGNYRFIDTKSIISGVSPNLITDSTSTYFIVPRKQTADLSLISTSTWFAQPYFFNSNNLSFSYGSEISFNITSTIIRVTTSSVFGGNPSLPPLVQLPTIPLPPGQVIEGLPCAYDPTTGQTDTSSWRYTFCWTGEYLLKANDQSKAYLSSAVDNYQNIFPFNIAYGVIGAIKDSSVAAQTWIDTYKLDLTMYGMTIPIINSSTLVNFVGSSNKNLIFNIEGAIAWVAVGYWILRIII